MTLRALGLEEVTPAEYAAAIEEDCPAPDDPYTEAHAAADRWALRWTCVLAGRHPRLYATVRGSSPQGNMFPALLTDEERAIDFLAACREQLDRVLPDVAVYAGAYPQADDLDGDARAELFRRLAGLERTWRYDGDESTRKAAKAEAHELVESMFPDRGRRGNKHLTPEAFPDVLGEMVSLLKSIEREVILEDSGLGGLGRSHPNLADAIEAKFRPLLPNWRAWSDALKPSHRDLLARYDDPDHAGEIIVRMMQPPARDDRFKGTATSLLALAFPRLGVSPRTVRTWRS